MVEQVALSALRLQDKTCDFGNGVSMRFPQNVRMTVDWIREGLKKPGKTQRGLAAAMGVDPAAISRLLAGTRQLKAVEVAKVQAYFDANPGDINILEGMHGKERTKLSQNPLLSEDKLKVLGLAECGPDGWATWNGEIVDWVARPANLAGAKDAYAVFIVGDSMEHRFHAGDIAFIHPGKPVTPGAYVLVQRKPKTAGDPPLAMIKRLVRRSGEKVTLEQHNPAKTIILTAGDIVSMHRVVGSVEA